jgi:YVTN family beta-propeller protein
MKRLLLSAAMLSAFAAAAAPATVPTGSRHYAVQRRFDLDGQGKWDYAAVDATRQRLYLSRGDHVQVLQLPSGQPIGDIANTPGIHDVAFAQDLGLGFASAGKSDSILVFDLASLKPRREIKVGGNPDALLYEPVSHKLFAFNGKSRDVSVIDARTLAVVATIPASGRPESAASDGAGRVYVNIEDNAGIDVIDIASNAIVARWKLAGCDEPSGLAIDTRHHGRHRQRNRCAGRERGDRRTPGRRGVRRRVRHGVFLERRRRRHPERDP